MLSSAIGHWQHAIDDYKEAVKLKEELLKEDNREVAEAHYKLALSYEFSKKFDLALQHTETVIRVLNKKTESLKALIGSEDAGEDAKEQSKLEIADIEGLLPAITTKVLL
jgi:tetratricopeptide (TPR) repeat protein